MTPINIINHEVLGLAVSGHEFYNLTTESKASYDCFRSWFHKRIRKLGLVEGQDFIDTKGKVQQRAVADFIVTIQAAKRFAPLATKNRAAGVLTYIKEYERTEGRIADVMLSTQSTTDAAAAHSATSAISVLPEAIQPKINFEAALPELEKLGPPNQPSPLPAAQPLSQIQQLLQQVQQLADEEAKRDQIPNELFASFDDRLKIIETKLNAVVFFFQQSANVLSNIVPVQSGVDPVPPVGPPTQEQTTRAKIVRLVDAWVITAKTTHQETWKYLYATLLQTSRFDVYAYGNGQKESRYLDIIEERGQLENLYAIADMTLRPKK